METGHDENEWMDMVDDESLTGDSDQDPDSASVDSFDLMVMAQDEDGWMDMVDDESLNGDIDQDPDSASVGSFDLMEMAQDEDEWMDMVDDSENDDDAISVDSFDLDSSQEPSAPQSGDTRRQAAYMGADCFICQESFEELPCAAEVLLPCQHVLCSDCCGKWIAHGKDACPFCRQVIQSRAVVDKSGSFHPADIRAIGVGAGLDAGARTNESTEQSLQPFESGFVEQRTRELLHTGVLTSMYHGSDRDVLAEICANVRQARRSRTSGRARASVTHEDLHIRIDYSHHSRSLPPSIGPKNSFWGFRSGVGPCSSSACRACSHT